MKLADGAERTLANGDPMLKRMDLAYAINTHMAQGITASVVYAVMGSFERNLSNARSFLVNLTRQQDDVRIFTDDRDKLMRQIASNRGDKLSALETTGELAVEARLAEYSAVTRGSGAAGAGAQDKAGASSPANSLGEELRGAGRDSRDLAMAEVLAAAADATVVAGERGDAGSGRKDDPDRFGLSPDTARPGLAGGKGPEDGPGSGPGDGPGGGGSGVSAPPERQEPERSQPERDRSKGLEL